MTSRAQLGTKTDIFKNEKFEAATSDQIYLSCFEQHYTHNSHSVFNILVDKIRVWGDCFQGYWLASSGS